MRAPALPQTRKVHDACLHPHPHCEAYPTAVGAQGGVQEVGMRRWGRHRCAGRSARGRDAPAGMRRCCRSPPSTPHRGSSNPSARALSRPPLRSANPPSWVPLPVAASIAARRGAPPSHPPSPLSSWRGFSSQSHRRPSRAAAVVEARGGGKGLWCRLEGVSRWDNRFELFLPKNLSCQCPPVKPVVVTRQTGRSLGFTGGTGQTGAPHRSDRCSTEHLQKQLQAPLGL
jgi:hypothetical protein